MAETHGDEQGRESTQSKRSGYTNKTALLPTPGQPWQLVARFLPLPKTTAFAAHPPAGFTLGVSSNHHSHVPC